MSSGIPASVVAAATVDYDAVQVLREGRLVYWIEGRPDGRDVLVCWTPDGGPREVMPNGPSVASRIHEYGGGAYLATPTDIWFCHATDQRLHRVSGERAVPVTSAPSQPAAIRYGDMRLDIGTRGLWCVRERHESGQVINELVWIRLDAGAEPVLAMGGWDFFSFPRPSPDGRYLAWTCWNAPLMPWDGTWLYVAENLGNGRLGEPVLVAGGVEESVFQPAWSPNGVLYFVSDRSGWWNLYRRHGKQIEPVYEIQAELGVAQWELGYSTYDFLDDDRIVVLAQNGGRQALHLINDGRSMIIDLPYTSIKPYISGSGSSVAIIASDPVHAPQIVLINVDTGTHEALASPTSIDHAVPYEFSRPRSFSYTTRDGGRVYGLYYAPLTGTNDPPPLIVKAHPGPTHNTPYRLNWHTQYLTSRGYAVVEIDYRGSTGYGRNYRQALRGQWGILDAYDCADSATYLVATGQANPGRIVIWGASAGAYTALRAITITDTFAAAIAHSPVIDPATWRNAAPKFQAHHTDSLIGPWPESATIYQERSILRHPGSITRPILILHGEADPITPSEQSRALAKAFGQRARLLIFSGEGHTLRSVPSITQALEAEMGFLEDLAS